MTGGTPLLHLRERTLHRYADGMLPRDEHGRVVAHLAECPRCRSRVAFARDVATAARGLAAPALDEALLGRVLAERAAGARAILPTATPAAARRRAAPSGLARVGATLAAVAALVLAVRAVTRIVHEPIGGPPSARPDVSAMFREGPGFFTGVARAQEWNAVVAFPPPATLLPGRMRALRASYEIRGSDPGKPDGPLAPVGESFVHVAPAAIDGHDAWRVVRGLYVEPGNGRRRLADTESVFVARADLRLLGRTEHVAPYRRYDYIAIRQRVSADSVVGWMNVSEGLGRPIRRKLPAAARPYTTDALAPVLLMAAPLDARWSGSVSMLRWAVVDGDVYSRVSLRVTGEEQVTVPAGTFDCWRLTVFADGRPLVHWVRKSDGLGVKTSTPGREIVLTDADR